VNKIQPVIKWTGSKNRQSHAIIEKFPKKINTFYEPFVGGGSVFRKLINSDIEFEKIVCHDLNVELIELWKLIINEPVSLIKHYQKEWDEFNLKTDYYYEVRRRFNQNKNPYDLLFLSRTSANGLIRYNSKGEFNSPVNKHRKGMVPDKLTEIIMDWHNAISGVDIEFKCESYENIRSKAGDFLYLDPPYANVNGDVYHGGINYDVFWNWLRLQQGNYAISFDGTLGNNDMTYEVPNDIYRQHLYINNGISGFKKIHNDTEHGKESLYIS
jgi:DNA adenine methylase